MLRPIWSCLLFAACATNATPPSAGDLGRAPADLSSAQLDLAPPPLDLAPPFDLADDDQGTIVSDALAATVIGSYATRTKTTAIQMLPVLGMQTSTTVALALVEIARKGQGLEITERGCHARIEGGSMLAMTTIPDAVPRSVPASHAPFRVWEDGGQVRWSRPESLTIVGAQLADPHADPLPTMAADPRVWDQDMDGQPGVTVKVAGFASGDIYVVQRQRLRQAGLVGSGGIAGNVVDGSEQSVIGASNATLNQNIASTPDPDPAKNTVELAKLQASYDCDKLVADEGSLF